MSPAQLTESRKNLITLAVLLLFLAFGAWLRLAQLDVFAPNVDEVMHLRIAEGRNLQEVWQFSLLETHPPLGHFLRYAWNRFLPPGDIAAARWPSVVLGLLAVPVYFGLGRVIGGRTGGLIAAAIVALSYLTVVQSMLVRNYPLFIVMIGLMFWAFLRLREAWSWQRLAVYGALALLSVLTHFGAVILVVACTAALAKEQWEVGLKRVRWKRVLAWLAVNGVVGLVFLALYLIQRPYLEPMMGQSSSRFNFFGFGGGLLLTMNSILGGRYSSLPFAAIAIFMFSRAIRQRKAPTASLKFIGLLLAGACLLAIFLSLFGLYPIDTYERRHLWLIAPLIATVVALVSAARPVRGHETPVSSDESAGMELIPKIVIGLAMVMGVVFFSTRGAEEALKVLHEDREEFSLTQKTLQEVRAHLESTLRPGDVVIADFHVAIYFFAGDDNLYRERWRHFGTDAVVSVPLGQGMIVTQPNRRYIRCSAEFRGLAAAALAAQPHPPGYRVFLINWALTNPAQQSLFETSPTEYFGERARSFQNIPNETSPPAEATVYPIDGESFVKEMLPVDGKFANFLGE